jgi:glycosyltransferase involved in cell wall biosynthesis
VLKNFFYYFLIKHSGLFDRHYYLNNYPDVRQADIDAIWHFTQKGWKEGRNPSNFFDTDFYLENNPDVQDANINPLVHYICYGKKERRHPNSNQEHDLHQFDFQMSRNNREPRFPVYSDNHEIFLPDKLEAASNNNKISPSLPDYRQFESPNITVEDPPQYKEKISVIIPTKDAGDNFNFLLKMWQNQKGFKDIEIIIVDSGSNDNTTIIANHFNAKVIEILPEEFSHSYARNLGAENATGNFLFFTVQDALPPTIYWLHELMTIFTEKDVNVVSCAEFLREDVDLFYRVMSWNQYHFLDVINKDKILSLPTETNYINYRKNGQISDLACLISKNLFLRYKYRFPYAEDLDLGIRLIKDGHKIAFLGNSRIIHSHNRPASYFLKRSYIENLILSDLFSDYAIPEVNFQNVAQDIVFTFGFLSAQIFHKFKDLSYPVTPQTLECVIKQILQSAETFSYSPSPNNNTNPYIDNFLNAIIRDLLMPGSDKVGNKYDGTLTKALIGAIDMTFNYVNSCYDLIDDNLSEEIIHCIYKFLSTLSGANLAFSYINGSIEVKEAMNHIHLTLMDSI